MKPAVPLLCLALVAGAACQGSPEESRTAAARSTPPQPSAASSSLSSPPLSPAPSSIPSENPPGPHSRLPTAPARLARDLGTTTQRLYREIDAWKESGLTSGSRRADVELLALHHQRLHRKLVGAPRLARSVIERLPAAVGRAAERNIVAGRGLRKLVTPVAGPVRLPTRRPEAPDRLLGYYRLAQRRYDVPWQVLAAVNFVESRFGRLTGPSVAGALGPMQFLPSTWDAYGGGGNVMDPHDAILGAANYLAASGAPERMGAALFAYNRSDAYVDAIRLYAREIARVPRNFYIYYFWQVFVVTTKGDQQLTGPGAEDN